jgi:hypothetical protein
MASYVKSTNFAVKDGLPSGDPQKVVKGTEIDTEFNNIATAVGSKADLSNPQFLGTPFAPTASPGTNTTQIATTAFVNAAVKVLYPVGSIYINASVATNPFDLLGFGTWVSFGAGRVLVGVNPSDILFDTVEETGGSKDAVVVSHTHSAVSVVTDPGHSHLANVPSEFAIGAAIQSGLASNDGINMIGKNVLTSTVSTGVTVATSVGSTGTSATNANLQPYITVFMWKRTA